MRINGEITMWAIDILECEKNTIDFKIQSNIKHIGIVERLQKDKKDIEWALEVLHNAMKQAIKPTIDEEN